MSRMPTPGSDNGEWGDILNDFLGVVHQPNGTLKDGTVTLATIASDTVVDLTNDQTVGGVKTFTDSPIVPTPTTGGQAVNKDYVDGFSSGNGVLVGGTTMGADAGAAVAIDSVTEGNGHTTANANGTIAIGYDGVNAASASGTSSIAIGSDGIADGEFAVALGSTASANGDSSTAIGWGAEATGVGAVALGGGTYSESGSPGAIANGDNSIAVGTSSAVGLQSLAVGSSSANGYESTAMGFNSSAQGDNTTAIGSGASSNSGASVAIGYNTGVDDNSYAAAALGVGSNIISAPGATGVNGNVYYSGGGVAVAGTVDTGQFATALNGQVSGSGGSANGAVAVGTDSGGNQATATVDNQFLLGTSNHNVEIPGSLTVSGDLQALSSLEVGDTLTVPTTAPSSPLDGQIWITSAGLFFRANGSTHGPLT